MSARQRHLLRLARLERGRRLRRLDQRARLGADDRASSRSARARRCSPTTAARSSPAPTRSACSRSAATSRSATTRTSAKSAATFRTINGARWSVPGDFATRRGRRHDRAARPRLGRASTRGGEKVYPEEVEEAVKVHPDVVDCLVVGVPDERFGEAVTAVVAPRAGGATLTTDDLAARARRARALQATARASCSSPRSARGPNGKADYSGPRSRRPRGHCPRSNENGRPAGRPRRRRVARGASSGELLLLLAADLGEHVARAEDQQVFAVDRDLGAAVLGVDDGVAGSEVDRR